MDKAERWGYKPAPMRPLHHPHARDITVEGLLHALADPVRARIYASLAQSTEALSCSAFLGDPGPALPKSTLSHHFKVLREAGLIRSERRGVEMRNVSRCAEIEQRFPGLLPAIRAAFGQQRSRAKRSRRT